MKLCSEHYRTRLLPFATIIYNNMYTIDERKMNILNMLVNRKTRSDLRFIQFQSICSVERGEKNDNYRRKLRNIN